MSVLAPLSYFIKGPHQADLGYLYSRRDLVSYLARSIILAYQTYISRGKFSPHIKKFK
jgi:hypothetical protein